MGTTTTTTSTTTTECSKCFTPFTMLDSACYYVSDAADTTTWAGAVSKCSALGGALATVESEAVDTAIGSEMQDDTWIGLNDPTAEKAWEWSEDAAALGSYANWYGSNPGTVATHTCVIKKNSKEGQWDDVGCNKDLPYACTADTVACDETTTTTSTTTTSTTTTSTTTTT